MATERKNIVFIMTDQQRSDYVGWHPQARHATPNLSRIAAGTSFNTCITPNPICTPARTALLTGKYTHQIGMLEMSGDLHPQHPTYPQALQTAGYFTAMVGKGHWLQTWEWGIPRGRGLDLVALKDRLMAHYGWDYLWESEGKQLALWNYGDYAAHLERHGLLERYRDFVAPSLGPWGDLLHPDLPEPAPFPLGLEHYVDVQTAERALEVLENRPCNQPFFLYVSFCGPHPPYDPPPEYLDQEPLEQTDDFLVVPGQRPLDPATKQRLYRWRRAYRAMIRLIDDQVGRLLNALEAQGLAQDTVVLFSSDHGEMLGDRHREGKSLPYIGSVQVPGAILHPDYPRGIRVDAPVELTDFTATILDIAGLDAQLALSRRWPRFNDRVPCRSLLPLARGEAESVREYAFSECGAAPAWQMLQGQHHKYIRYAHTPEAPGPEELYDLAADPQELHNLAADPQHAQTLERFRQQLWRTLDLTPTAQTSWAPLPTSPEGPVR